MFHNTFHFSRDYRPMPALDRYERDVLDDQEYDNISQSDRLAAEAAMRRRDREEGLLMRRGDRELIYEDSDDEEEPRRKRRMAEKAAAGEIDDEDMVESIENLEDTKGMSVKEWVSMLGPRTEIANRFKSFLRNYVNSKGQYVFKDRIRRMCESNHSSLEVNFRVCPCTLVLCKISKSSFKLFSRWSLLHWLQRNMFWLFSCLMPLLKCWPSLMKLPRNLS